MIKPKFPTTRELAWAILEVLKDCGKPMATREIVLLVAKKLSLPPEVIDAPHKAGSTTELQYQIGWVLMKLKVIGAVENVERGYWSLTNRRDKSGQFL